VITVVHNGAVLVIAAQICVIYGTAGLLKVQGSMWQDGSALGYVLRLNWFHPWPALSAWLAGHAIALTIAGYTTVFVQAGFPFLVFSPRLKYPALAALVLMHTSIAVLLGLPFFSAIMLVGDALFLPGRFWQAAALRLRAPAYARSMSTATTALPVNAVRPTLVFDGDCGFCTASVHLLERWCRPAVRFVPWQTLDLGAHRLTQEQVSKAVQWLPATADAPIRPGAAAVAQVLLRSRLPWRPLGALMIIPPVSWLAAAAYRVISANRYRLPGSTPACAVTAKPEPAPVPEPAQSDAPPAPSTQRLGDLSGGAHDAGTGTSRVELAERDHAD
jgi:predicted DCC family thiol-disulfide oxidoreductase YuxK